MKNKKNFLVTGGTGFIGSNICDLLVRQGHRVTIFDNNSRGNLKKIKKFYETLGEPYPEDETLDKNKQSC